MKIILEKLRLKNFKGIKSKEIEFNQRTCIAGANATGKTTIVDAFFWLLFDKDSSDRNNFSIKTHDKHGNVIHNLDHEVEAHLRVDGKPLTLMKTYREKWTRKRGESHQNLTGHTTSYEIDGSPVKKSEYTEKIGMLIDMDTFKLITNPMYFNQNLHWQNRRDLLIEILGEVDNEDVIKSNKKLEPLREILMEKDLDQYKKELASKRKKLNDELKMIPIRIDEITQGMPEEEDTEELQRELSEHQAKLEEIEEAVASASKGREQEEQRKSELIEEKYRIQNLIRDKEQEILNIQRDLRAGFDKKKSDLETEIQTLKGLIDFREKEIPKKEVYVKDKQSKVDELKSKNKELTEKFYKVRDQKLEIDENKFNCPTCLQSLPEDQIEQKRKEMIENHKKHVAEELQEIQETGKNNKDTIENLGAEIKDISETIALYKDHIAEYEDSLESLNGQLESLQAPATTNDKIKELESDIKDFLKVELASIEEQLETFKAPKEDSLELKEQKKEVLEAVDGIKDRIRAQEQISKSKERINELVEREADLSNQISELEGQEFLAEEYTRTKVDFLESRVNEKFETVRFKLFDQQVNGGLSDTCVAMINGVPYEDANNAAKINAGLEIIEVISNHYDRFAPIFIDNAEAVNYLKDTSSQQIELRVTTDKKLKVENNEKEVA